MPEGVGLFKAPPDKRLNISRAQSARKVAAERRAEDEERQFQKQIALYRDSGSTFRETKASVRKTEETRLRIEQDLEVHMCVDEESPTLLFCYASAGFRCRACDFDLCRDPPWYPSCTRGSWTFCVVIPLASVVFGSRLLRNFSFSRGGKEGIETQRCTSLVAAQKPNRQNEERERAAALAEEARQREVSRAVREYVAASEARRREEHGAGPLLDELIRRKKVSDTWCLPSGCSVRVDGTRRLQCGVERNSTSYLALCQISGVWFDITSLHVLTNISQPIFHLAMAKAPRNVCW